MQYLESLLKFIIIARRFNKRLGLILLQLIEYFIDYFSVLTKVEVVIDFIDHKTSSIASFKRL